jgi:hypothetical protein
VKERRDLLQFFVVDDVIFIIVYYTVTMVSSITIVVVVVVVVVMMVVTMCLIFTMIIVNIMVVGRGSIPPVAKLAKRCREAAVKSLSPYSKLENISLTPFSPPIDLSRNKIFSSMVPTP